MADQKLYLQLGVNVDAFEKDFDEAVSVTKGAAANIEKEAAKMALKVSSKLESMTPTRQQRQLENLAVKMTELGMEGTEAFQMVIKSAGNLKSTIADTSALIDAMQPDAPFRALSNTVTGAAHAFAGLQGAMALLGDESQETQEMLLKVQAAMAVAEGLESIGELEDAFTQVGAVIKSSVIPSLFTLKGALIATGIGAAAVAIGMLISHFNEMADAADEAAEAADRALNFEKDVNKLDKIDEQIALNRAKARGASDRELYEIKYRYAVTYYNNLIAAQKKAGNDGYKFDLDILEQRKQILLLNSEFELAEYEKRNKAHEKSAKKHVKDEYDQWKEIERVRSSVKGFGAGIYKPITVSANATVKAIEAVPHAIENTAEKLKRLQREINTIAINITQLLNSTIANGINTMAESLGNALATGQDVAQSIGRTFLIAMTDFLKQFGQLIIAAGVAKLNLDTALAIPGGAPAAIAAGVALVALSGAIKAHAEKGVQVPKFADGGLIYGPTLGLMGEYPGARSNPEVIAPLSKLESIIGGSGTMTARIDGRDLLIITDRNRKDFGRG